MLLRSFSFGQFYGVDAIPEQVLGLFSSLVENKNKRIEYASEIMDAGLQGRINLNKEFNIDGYEATITMYNNRNKEKKRKKETYINFNTDSEDWENVSRSGGITEDVVSYQEAQKMQSEYDKLILDDSLRFAVETIKNLQPILFAEAKVDFIKVIKNALACVPGSVETVKKICNDYPILGEQVSEILSSGVSFKALFAN